jgi:hypothetical protein
MIVRRGKLRAGRWHTLVLRRFLPTAEIAGSRVLEAWMVSVVS